MKEASEEFSSRIAMIWLQSSSAMEPSIGLNKGAERR
jgi:hypothetical protein